MSAANLPASLRAPSGFATHERLAEFHSAYLALVEIVQRTGKDRLAALVARAFSGLADYMDPEPLDLTQYVHITNTNPALAG